MLGFSRREWRVLAPLSELSDASRERLEETLRHWLLHRGRREPVAEAQRHHAYPPERVRLLGSVERIVELLVQGQAAGQVADADEVSRKEAGGALAVDQTRAGDVATPVGQSRRACVGRAAFANMEPEPRQQHVGEAAARRKATHEGVGPRHGGGIRPLVVQVGDDR